MDVATNMEEFGIKGPKQSIARAAVITGLSRRGIVRVCGLPSADDDPTSAQKLNRAGRVIATGCVSLMSSTGKQSRKYYR